MLLAGRYEVSAHIAGGSTGQVFRAIEAPSGREMALKVLAVDNHTNAERFKKRFRREASIASQLTHPNIVTIYDYGETESGDMFIAMELLRGRSLADLLEREGRLPMRRAVAIAIQLARALRKAHHQGVVHRDLKPANIIVTEDADGADAVKVLDFGLVKVLARDEGEVPGAFTDDNLTAAGSLMGTPGYMSPEQAIGEPADARADIYALGVILFQMLTGKLPFVADDFVELVKRQVLDPVPSLRTAAPDLRIPDELDGIVMRCLDKLREERFASVDELLVHLKIVWRTETDESFGTESIQLPPSPVILAPVTAPDTLIVEPTTKRRSPAFALMLLALALLGTAAGLYVGAHLQQQPDAPPSPATHGADYKSNPY